MKTVRSAVVGSMIGAAALGLAGIARTASLHDPGGLWAVRGANGDRTFAAAGPAGSAVLAFPASGPQERQIIDYLTAVLLDFDAQAGRLGSLDVPQPRPELVATSRTYVCGNTHTVVVKVDQNLGTAHPATWYRSFSYDRAATAPITFGTLFRPGARPLDVIAPSVAEQLNSGADQPITIDPSVAENPAHYRNFAITAEAVLFFFDRDQLHPACRPTEVAVPRAAIADLLNPGL
ncbi:DUF3298 domain-containing protein [Mycolicibacterium sp. S2-37]|uniref:RsiV family protein n=1 Tax=Mycolicibacterium sp. S2-37 TaxID=2810297 RepID=UPI001A93D66D|nr:RsiV family protein [Mycolicibacterium sp. S2-37]MBO0678393.1 DUF3298 domain-containing protein [Mycolicibacterium sp. S2-37]